MEIRIVCHGCGFDDLIEANENDVSNGFSCPSCGSDDVTAE